MLIFKHLLQDLNAFSQENFDPKEWINSVFRSQDAQQNRDVRSTFTLQIAA